MQSNSEVKRILRANFRNILSLEDYQAELSEWIIKRTLSEEFHSQFGLRKTYNEMFESY